MRAQSLERQLIVASLALVLAVVVASAAIRLGGEDLGSWLAPVRGAHRVCASLATLLIAALAWLSWRGGRRLVVLLVVLVTAGLSLLGAATGVSPPVWAQAGNLLGGLALAALLAWLLGLREGAVPHIPRRATALVALQVLLGVWIAIFAEELWTPIMLGHALLGATLAGAAAWLAVKKGALLAVLLALAVPASGAASALFGLPLGAMLVHSASVALLICAAAYAQARVA